jgi:hypothetical protein
MVVVWVVRVRLGPAAGVGACVFFGGAEDVLAELFEELAGGGEPGSDSGVGAAQHGGGESLVGMGTDYGGADARVLVEEVPVAPAVAVDCGGSVRAGAAGRPRARWSPR